METFIQSLLLIAFLCFCIQAKRPAAVPAFPGDKYFYYGKEVVYLGAFNLGLPGVRVKLKLENGQTVIVRHDSFVKNSTPLGMK